MGIYKEYLLFVHFFLHFSDTVKDTELQFTPILEIVYLKFDFTKGDNSPA